MSATLTIHLSDPVLWFLAGFIAFPMFGLLIALFVAVANP